MNINICGDSLMIEQDLFQSQDDGLIPISPLQDELVRLYPFDVQETNKNDVGKFIQKFHYSPIFPKLTKHWLGIYDKQYNIVGAVTLGWGTQPKNTIKKLFPSMDTKDYLEIGKMCMDESMPRNSETQMLKAVVRWIKQYRKDVQLLYTLADGIMGKCGYVYQAFNFYYGGSYLTDVYLSSDGEKIHPRSMKNILKDNANFKNVEKLFWATPDYLKIINMRRIRGLMFRYILPLTKSAKLLIRNNESWTKLYPKHNSLIWKEQTVKGYINIEKPDFNFSKISYNKKNFEQFK